MTKYILMELNTKWVKEIPFQYCLNATLQREKLGRRGVNNVIKMKNACLSRY